MQQIIPDRPSTGPRRVRSRWILCAVACLWGISIGAGLWQLWSYDNTPGAAAHAPRRWPSPSQLAHASDGPTLVLLAHPQCSCTRATLAELAEVLARAERPPKTYVLFLKPFGSARDWEKTDLWRTAAGLPHVTVMRDDDGMEAARFGALTSGQAVLYDERGMLLFSGGITGARAHAGDNSGRASLVALLNHQSTASTWTSVFGCPLFQSAS
jgi:hypothetical protein